MPLTPQEQQAIGQAIQNATGQAWAKIRQLEEALRELRDKSMRPRFVEDIPGKRVAYTYVAQDEFNTTSVGTEQQLSFLVSQDGPFVATSKMAFWRPTTAGSANVGRWRPISSIQGTTGATSGAVDSIDFEYKITQGGPDRNQQNLPLASHDLFTDGDRPSYLGIANFFERNETVLIDVTMLRNPTTTGLLKFEFQGYKILQPIAFAG